jgi:aspartate/glutamate racemase/prolyl-tRNA editing enzyme YbaK/EbsC (Cys-tRNA(Pro) deacylase)
LTAREDLDIELNSLMVPGETIPQSVRRCAGRLKELGVWHTFSRNSPATSCQDAARKRNRLGHQGIPLWDELKSFLGEYHDQQGTRQIFLAHCRGDRKLDLDKLRSVLQFAGEIRRVSLLNEARLWEAHHASYGTVNPIMEVGAEVQIFDHELHRPIGVPSTVMTNAGEHSWAVEFDPAELVLKLRGARWADIVQPETEDSSQLFWGVREPQTIGILTGNPCDSGLDLCDAINKHLRQLLGKNSLGDVSMPKIVIVSAPEIGISMEMDKREDPLRKALLQIVDELCAAGAKLLAHPAHTTHYFAPDIATRASEKGARFLSMVDATLTKLRSSGVTEITLLGTKYVTDFSQKWSVYADAFAGMKVHLPSPEGWKKILDLGYEVQQTGPTSLCFNWMRDLLREEVPASCKHVVLAMTEFSPILRHLKARGRQGKILIDPVDIYGEAIALEYLAVQSPNPSLRSQQLAIS